MKIIVIGLGSMGKRRIRLLTEKKEIELFGIDSNKERCKEVSEQYAITCYSNIAEACEKEGVEAAVISTSPLSHASIINECLYRGLHVFTEINLVSDMYDSNIALAKEMDKVLFLSSTFLYEEDTRTIIERLKGKSSRTNYIYHVGQYLPDWHPWENYKNFFIGDKRTNGCREILAIDLPWIIEAFGNIKNIHVMKSKNSSLNIDYDDNYIIMIEHEAGAKGVFAVDVITRKPIRHFEAYSEDQHIIWDGDAESLYEWSNETKEMIKIQPTEAIERVAGYADFISENPYRLELNAFLQQISDPAVKPVWNFERDKSLLSWIDKIEDYGAL